MRDVFIIIKGQCVNQFGGFKDVWEESLHLNGYYESKYSAEIHLMDNGYERDSDDVYFLVDADEDNQELAKVIPLTKRD